MLAYCAISNLPLQIAGIDSLVLPATAGYFHPIFAATYPQLQIPLDPRCS